MDTNKGRVLVTGITGFLGSHVSKLLLEKGYKVRGTIRDKNNEKKMKPLDTLPNKDNLEIVEAELLKSETWQTAAKDCDFIIHVASPFPIVDPKDENELINPAVKGTLSVLMAATENKVKAVVITSSIAAIFSTGKSAKDLYTEDDWADVSTIPAYNKSKTLAEKAAWDYYKGLDPNTRFRLTSINPGLIFGPALISTDFSSGELIKEILTGEAPGIPRISFAVVDVRDVALAEVMAIENPTCDGQRYICTSDDNFWFEDISQILQDEFSKYGYKVTKCKVCYCCVKCFSICDAKSRAAIPSWGHMNKFNNEKIKKAMDIKFISGKESVIKMAYSLIENGVVPNLLPKTARKNSRDALIKNESK